MGGAQCQVASCRQRGRLRAAAARAGRLGRPHAPAPALSAANRELRSLTDYEKDPAKLYAARAKLAGAIEALATAR